MTRATLVAEWDVSRETLARLESYNLLLQKWNPAINLVSKSTLPDSWDRHFRDSAQLLALAPRRATKWMDLGSGGGFPGMVIAVLAAETHQDLSVTLVEADQRKSAFLHEVARATGIRVTIVPRRIEALAVAEADVLSARALGSLTALLGHAVKHLAKTGVAFFPKGATHMDEIATARKEWAFDLQIHKSVVDPNSVVLQISDVAHV